jgi:hypothetical protein
MGLEPVKLGPFQRTVFEPNRRLARILRHRRAPNFSTRCLRIRTDGPAARGFEFLILPTIVKCIELHCLIA